MSNKLIDINLGRKLIEQKSIQINEGIFDTIANYGKEFYNSFLGGSQSRDVYDAQIENNYKHQAKNAVKAKNADINTLKYKWKRYATYSGLKSTSANIESWMVGEIATSQSEKEVFKPSNGYIKALHFKLNRDYPLIEEKCLENIALSDAELTVYFRAAIEQFYVTRTLLTGKKTLQQDKNNDVPPYDRNRQYNQSHQSAPAQQQKTQKQPQPTKQDHKDYTISLKQKTQATDANPAENAPKAKSFSVKNRFK